MYLENKKSMMLILNYKKMKLSEIKTAKHIRKCNFPIAKRLMFRTFSYWSRFNYKNFIDCGGKKLKANRGKLLGCQWFFESPFKTKKLLDIITLSEKF
jgi:hypothetical protein